MLAAVLASPARGDQKLRREPEYRPGCHARKRSPCANGDGLRERAVRAPRPARYIECVRPHSRGVCRPESPAGHRTQAEYFACHPELEVVLVDRADPSPQLEE